MEPQDKAMLSQMSVCSAVGTGAEIAHGMSDFIEQTGADELMLVSSIFDHEKRKYAFELAALAGQNTKFTPSQVIADNRSSEVKRREGGSE